MIKYKFEPENNRVAAYLEDGKEVGKLTFIPNCDVWDADHTFVDADHRGGTIAGDMLKLLVDTARAEGKLIHPSCPYVAKVMDKVSEYQDILKR